MKRKIVSSAAGKGKPSPERSAFLDEIQKTGVELPADMPTVLCEPELHVIARRLLQAGERMQDELQKILAPAQSEAPSQVRHGAMMLHDGSSRRSRAGPTRRDRLVSGTGQKGSAI